MPERTGLVQIAAVRLRGTPCLQLMFHGPQCCFGGRVRITPLVSGGEAGQYLEPSAGTASAFGGKADIEI